MNSAFLICGYPRSRTFWLSKFLSVPGVSICTHEACEFAGSVEEFWNNAEYSTAAGCEFYGNSDSANIYVLRSMLAERPLTKVVWIDRPIDEVRRSMQSIGMPVIEHALENLMIMREYNESCFDMVIPYRDLHYAAVCRQLWEFCLPGVQFSYARWGLYDCQKLGYSKEHPMPQKDFVRFLHWVQHELDGMREERAMG